MTTRAGFIGFGAVAENAHAPVWLKESGVSFVAVADESASRRAAARKLFPGIRDYPTPGALLDGEPDLDFVDIATPPHLHAPQILAALSAGVHVLCEKPLTLSVSEFESVRREAAKRRRAVFPIHNWKHAPIFVKLKELLKAKAIGTVLHSEWHTLRKKPAATAGQSKKNWRTDPRLSGGGILMDHGWHGLYLIELMMGRHARRVHGALKPSGSGTENESTCLLEFQGGSAVMHLSWNSPRRGHWGVVYGKDGHIELHDDRLLVTRGDSPPQSYVFPEPLSHGSAHPEWFSGMLGDFTRAMADNELALAALDEAGRVIALIEDVYRPGADSRRQASNRDGKRREESRPRA